MGVIAYHPHRINEDFYLHILEPVIQYCGCRLQSGYNLHRDIDFKCYTVEVNLYAI